MRRFFPNCFTNNYKAEKPQLQAMASERKVEYTTGIGRVSITWSRAITGISIFTQIDLSNNASRPSTTSSSPLIDHFPNITDDQRCPFSDFKLSPCLPAQRCGLRLFNLYGRGTDITKARRLEIAWDFTNAQYDVSRDVQPVSGYYFCIAAEGEMVLLLGDMKVEAHNHVKTRQGSVLAIPVAREETVNLRGCIYSTKVLLGGVERDIAVNFKRRMEDSMTVWIDRRKVVEVETKWGKFEGSREVDVPGGVVKIMWDRQEWTDRENTACCSAAREFAIARLTVSYAEAGGSSTNAENYFHLNLFC
jgi:Plant protein of unknown function (DUF868)